MRRGSLQFKFGLSYILIIAAVLGVMNTYPLLVSQDMTFRAKQSTLQNSVSVMVSSLSGIDRLSAENVPDAMSASEATGISRILVVNDAGLVVYDSRETMDAVGRYAFYSEIVQALSGNDVFHCAYDGTSFKSRAASPVTYRNQTIGAVFAYEYDAEQAMLLRTLQTNLRTISLAVGAFVVLLSLVLSKMFTRSIEDVLAAIAHLREGAYGARAEVRGNDEIAEIAKEFNAMAARVQTNEDERRRFVSDASHELKTPLAGICLLTDSILQNEQMDSGTVREFLGDIREEAQRLSRITEHLLRLTRLDSNAVGAAERVLVAPVVERTVRMLSVIAQEKDVSLSCDIPRGCAVFATQDDLHEIVYNLMENAIKYNHAGGEVCVAACEDGNVCVITVEDNGVGIPEDDMERIFERFYRVDKMRSREAGGTGLGLSIVRDTARRRGGSVTAERREGGGTRFTVRLPLARGEGAGE
ncbi:MAG: HAMP domain-containing histidine kinase [Oscillospiraceae bacterium]|nr:HAMP domain-containing histidine kinase [Oscillospiraceae bacterium]